MKTLKNWVLNRQAADHVELKVDGQHLFRIYILESGLFRVLIKQRGELALNRTWSIAPQRMCLGGGVIVKAPRVSHGLLLSWYSVMLNCVSAPTKCG